MKLPAVFLSINGRKERWTGRRGLHIGEKPGFKQLGTIPGGFRLGSCLYEDVYPYYIVL